MRLASTALVLLVFGWWIWSGKALEHPSIAGSEAFMHGGLAFFSNDGTMVNSEVEEKNNISNGTGRLLRPLDNQVDIQKLRHVNERFTYEVRYGFLRLGNVHVYLKGDTRYRNTDAIHMVTEMVSNQRIPLIGYKEAHYHNYMAWNDTIPYGLRFWQNSLHRNIKERFVYEFDYETGKVYSFEEGESIDTLELDRPADSGPAIMYYSRMFAGTDHHTSYPVYIDHEKSQVRMHFTSQKESYDSPAFPDEKVNAYFMSGTAEFEGPFGFSGDFTAYFKDDELRIPLEARVSIWLGSVRVRLVEYERMD